MIDIGKDLQNAFDEGYKQGRYDEKVETGMSSPNWIPCSERLPSKSDHKDDMVLVCYGNGSVRFNTCKNGQWCQGNPLAWMPLPEAWEGECE